MKEAKTESQAHRQKDAQRNRHNENYMYMYYPCDIYRKRHRRTVALKKSYTKK